MLFKRGHAYVTSTVDKGGSHILRQPCGRDWHFELQPASRVHRSVVFADSLLDCPSVDSVLLGQRAIQR